MIRTHHKIKRILCVLLAVCLLAAALPLHAFAIEVDYVIASIAGGFIRVNQYTGVLQGAGGELRGDVSIPDTVEGVKVTAIGDRAFYGCEYITSVTVPASVKTVGAEAFQSCLSLKTANIANGVESLGKDAFRYCYALSKVSLPASLRAIEDNTFRSCLSLTSITIPSGVDRVGAYAFADCPKLSSVSLPGTAVSLGEYCFKSCKALKSVTLPAGLFVIPTALFDGCESIEQLVVPSGVSVISGLAFRGCRKLSKLALPDSITSIAKSAFESCGDMTFYVNAGSYAQAFAAANSIPFVLGGLSTVDPKPNEDPNYNPTPFTDDKSHWAKKYIEWIYAMGYMTGTSNTRFSPEAEISRGMVATILYRMEGSPAVGTSTFTDLTSSSSKYYKDGISWAESTKVVSGMGNGKFGPDVSVSREQLAVMLYNYAAYKGKNTAQRGNMNQFSDTSAISSWAGTAVSWAVGAGIISGKSGGKLDPKGTATRAEAAVMLYKFSQLS